MPLLQPWAEYVAEVTAKHHGYYAYNNPVPVNGKIEVTCPVHGPFWIRKNSHKSGNGCSQCSGRTAPVGVLRSDPLEQLKKSKPHYDFSASVYISNKKPITFVCPKHGVKTSTPHTILLGTGCDECGIENKRRNVARARTFIDKTPNKLHTS